mmetsp:Transcript_6765/g.11632  ORF Transcript_6765/g.11632 Transcript_6765/m.11632 type:complete len:219 (+) Transcript_6765:104-760(+)
MRRIFGTGKPKPQASLTDCVSTLEARGDNLDTKIKKLDAELAQYKAKMKGMKPGPALSGLKQRAMRVLKQKRMYETQRDSLSNQAFNLDQAAFAQQTAKETITTVEAMKQGVKELKKAHKGLNINQIEDLHDDMADLLEDSNEIQDILGRAYGLPEDIDESELDAELAALEDDLAMEESTGEAPSYLQSKVPPSAPPVAEQETVDDYGLPNPPQKIRA